MSSNQTQKLFYIYHHFDSRFDWQLLCSHTPHWSLAMKAHDAIFPLKQLKQLWIVVAHERGIKNLFLKPNTPQEAATNWTLFRKTKCHWPCLWCKNNLNCELNSSVLAAIYVGTVQYFLCRPLEDSGCSVETLHVGSVVSWPFVCPANNLCLSRAMQQHNYPWCPLLS